MTAYESMTVTAKGPVSGWGYSTRLSRFMACGLRLVACRYESELLSSMSVSAYDLRFGDHDRNNNNQQAKRSARSQWLSSTLLLS